MRLLVKDRELGTLTTIHMGSSKKSIIQDAWKSMSKRYEFIKIIK